MLRSTRSFSCLLEMMYSGYGPSSGTRPTCPIVPQHVWKDVSEKDIKSYPAEPKNGKPVVGSGPFRLVSGTADGSTFKFEANPHYWGKKPKLADKAIARFIEQVGKLQKGQ